MFSWFENSEKKEKETLYFRNVSVFGLVKKELGIKKNDPKKGPIFLYIFFIDVNS